MRSAGEAHMNVLEELLENAQPDDAIDFVSWCLASLRDRGGSLEWRWLGIRHVELTGAAGYGVPKVLELRIVDAGNARSIHGNAIMVGDVVPVLMGKRDVAKFRPVPPVIGRRH
jgi:hypothetical protein